MKESQLGLDLDDFGKSFTEGQISGLMEAEKVCKMIYEGYKQEYIQHRCDEGQFGVAFLCMTRIRTLINEANQAGLVEGRE